MKIVKHTVSTYAEARRLAEEFYTSCQVEDNYDTASHILTIEVLEERDRSIVAVSDTWPVAVTTSNGGLHSPNGESWLQFYAIVRKYRADHAELIAGLEKAREIALNHRFPLFF